MPQLSPMSWVMVISVFLVCLVFFGVVLWWLVDGKYNIKQVANNNTLMKSPMSKSFESSYKKGVMKWGFGKSY
nr:ATP synthase subunit 8 [Alasmidonta varicosa]